VDANLSIHLERPAGISLSEQIRSWISAAIHDGRLQAGARLPSWRDLAAQLGVARGTVRVAYERLGDEQLIVACGPAGTFVAEHVPVVAPVAGIDAINVPSHAVLSELVPRLGAAPMPFQMGVPAHDAFPTAAWSRLAARSARIAAERGVYQPDPRGEPDLRYEIAAHLSIARGLRCTSEQIFVTNGYAGALGLVLRALDLKNDGHFEVRGREGSYLVSGEWVELNNSILKSRAKIEAGHRIVFRYYSKRGLCEVTFERRVAELGKRALS